MVSPDDAMKCCDSMPCPSHNHDAAQDCCKSMAAMHGPFIQPSAQTLSISAVFIAVVPSVSQAHPAEFSFGVVAAHWHAPPISPASNLTPLRI
jgi:hypothetical protein